ncbi:MAG: hypothetical protein M1826_004078 [Phylliscum demangeonii]|nr:MAG: hypothetical protein M1826_004078 [Phylliscum demangeonii]
MKLTFKDLKQQKFVVEAEPTETILQIKEKIAAEKGWEAGLQKLIYSGKILQDQQTVESYSIEEKGFIVCMISKPKAPPAAPAAPSTPAVERSSTPAQPAAPAASSNAGGGGPNTAPATPTPATTTAESAASPSFNDPSALALGAQRDAAIANMESMGFQRTEIDRAMRAAFFNPDRAVEYLLNGIPESVQQERRQAPHAPAPEAASSAGAAASLAALPTDDEGGDQPINLFEAAAQAGRSRGSGSGAGAGGRSGGGAAGAGDSGGSGGSGGTGTGTGGGLGSLDFLRNNPQFQQLRQVVQQQPNMLEPILQQVGAGNPQLAQLIGQNPAQFLQLLGEDADDDAPLPPGAQAVSVTEDEREAIERLCRLGFDRNLVIQAYFACDKNEELAANFLFDQPDDLEDS